MSPKNTIAATAQTAAKIKKMILLIGIDVFKMHTSLKNNITEFCENLKKG